MPPAWQCPPQFGVVLLRHLVSLGSRLLSVSVLTLSRAMSYLSLRLCLPLLKRLTMYLYHLFRHFKFPIGIGRFRRMRTFCLCPGDSEMDEFRSSEDNNESSNGDSDEEAGQDSQPLFEIPVSGTAPAVPVSQEVLLPP